MSCYSLIIESTEGGREGGDIQSIVYIYNTCTCTSHMTNIFVTDNIHEKIYREKIIPMIALW